MSANSQNPGPMKLAPEDHVLSASVQKKVQATAASRQPRKTLIQTLSKKGAPTSEEGNILVGTMRT